jgi:hypothetical protein
MDGQQTIKEALQMLYEKPTKNLFRHDAPCWTNLDNQRDARTRGPA